MTLLHPIFARKYRLSPVYINVFHIAYVRLSPLSFRVSIARKLCMNLFTSARQGVLRRKFFVGLVVLVAVGVVGGGKALSQLPSNEQKIVNCPSHTNPCATLRTPQSTITI